MSAQSQRSGSGYKRIYVTLAGLPLSFELHWPFHKSTSGADFWVLHADIRLENSSGLQDRKSTRLNSSHGYISYAVFCLKKKKARHKSEHSDPLPRYHAGSNR